MQNLVQRVRDKRFLNLRRREAMNEKWLYGASVQGIQGYIFQTNKLKDVIGASELGEGFVQNKLQERVCLGRQCIREYVLLK